MAIRRYADANCSSCHGRGYVSEGRLVGDEWWQSFSDCHCVETNIDADTKERIRAALAFASDNGTKP